MNEIKVGDVRPWLEVPDGALVRDKDGDYCERRRVFDSHEGWAPLARDGVTRQHTARPIAPAPDVRGGLFRAKLRPMRKLAIALLALSTACSPCGPVPPQPGADAPAPTSGPDLPADSTGSTGGSSGDEGSSGSSGAPLVSEPPIAAPVAPPPVAVEVVVQGGPMRAAK